MHRSAKSRKMIFSSLDMGLYSSTDLISKHCYWFHYALKRNYFELMETTCLVTLCAISRCDLSRMSLIGLNATNSSVLTLQLGHGNHWLRTSRWQLRVVTSFWYLLRYLCFMVGLIDRCYFIWSSQGQPHSPLQLHKDIAGFAALMDFQH